MVKDESGGKQIVEFVDVRNNFYSHKMLYGSEYKECKGVSKNATKRSIQFDDDRECLFRRREQHWKMYACEVIVMRSMARKLIKLSSLLTMTNELLWLTEYRL